MNITNASKSAPFNIFSTKNDLKRTFSRKVSDLYLNFIMFF